MIQTMEQCVKWVQRKPAVAGLTALVVAGSLVLASQLLKSGETELPLHAILKGSTKIHRVVFSPDAKTLATVEADHTIKLWDAATGQERAVLKGKPILQARGGLDDTLHFSPDSATLATAGYADNGIALKLWDVATGKERATLKGPSRIRSVVFSPGGKTVAVEGLEDAIALRDAATGKKRATLKTTNFLRDTSGIHPAVILSPDGKIILTAGKDGTIKLWDVATGRERATLQRPIEDLRKAVFSPDGKNLVTMSGKNRAIKLWDVATGRERATLITSNEPGPTGPRGPIAPKDERELIFSPDGKILATHENYTLRLWDVATANQRRIIRQVAGGKFSPDGKRLITSVAFTSKLWDVATGKQLAAFKGINRWAFTPDGKTLATANEAVTYGKTQDGIVQFWDAATGRLLDTLKLKDQAKEYLTIAFSPDGRTLVTRGSGAVRFWDVATRKERATLKGGLTAQLSEWKLSPDGKTLAMRVADKAQFWDVATATQRAIPEKADTLQPASVMLFSPDGKTLATGGFGINDKIKLWDVATGQLRAALEPTGRNYDTVAFSPDSKTVATAVIRSRSGLGGTKLWDVATGRELATFPSVPSVVFSPQNNTLVTIGTEVAVRMWDVATAQERTALESPPEGIRTMRFSPDGKTLATMMESDAPRDRPPGQPGIDSVMLWDTATGKQRATLKGGGDGVFSPDGQTLATTKRNGTKLWDVATGKERIPLWGNWFLAFSPDGKTLATASGGAVKLWDAMTGEKRSTLEGIGEAILDPDEKVVGVEAVFSRDGKILATQSNEAVKLWDVATGKERATLKGAGKVIFSPDGKILATEPRGGTKLWDAATGKARATLRGQFLMALSPDGSLLATSDDRKDIRLWRLHP